MSVRMENGIAVLGAPSRVEDAEPLLDVLRRHRDAGTGALIDASGGGALHAAVVQLLLAFRPSLEGGLGDPLQRALLGPLLSAPPR